MCHLCARVIPETSLLSSMQREGLEAPPLKMVVTHIIAQSRNRIPYPIPAAAQIGWMGCGFWQQEAAASQVAV